MVKMEMVKMVKENLMEKKDPKNKNVERLVQVMNVNCLTP
jgi:hypothetical protein